MHLLIPLITYILLLLAPSGLCHGGRSRESRHGNLLTYSSSYSSSTTNKNKHGRPPLWLQQGSHRRLATGDVLNGNLPAECADALCLVQALLNRRPQIFITSNIDLRGVGILPTIEGRVSISGVCETSKCRVDAGGEAGIFVVGLGGYLSLKDLHLTGGFCSRGPAVLVSGLGAFSSPSPARLQALNVHFSNNIATDVGGAVAIESGGSAFVKNSVFYNNKATKGGAVYVGGSSKLPTTLGMPPPVTNPSSASPSSQDPAGCSFRSCTTFANTEFSRNQADVAGGAVYVDDSTPDCADVGGAQLDCTACTFVNNTARHEGGAIQLVFLSSGATANTKQSAFLSNIAGEDGGDVNVQAGQVGAPGAQLHSYTTVFSASSAPKGLSVAVGHAASATFNKCDFSSYTVANSAVCEGTCNVTCPVDKRLQQLQGSCPDVLPPAPICPWVPEDCPPPVESTLPSHLPTPSPPSIAPPQVVLSPSALPPPWPHSAPPSPVGNLSSLPPPISNPSSPPLPPNNPSPPPPQSISSPPLLPLPSPSSNPSPPLHNVPPSPPPPRGHSSVKRPPPPPLNPNSTSLPPPPPKRRWTSPPPQGQGSVKNAPPAPPPPPQGQGSVENAPPVPHRPPTSSSPPYPPPTSSSSFPRPPPSQKSSPPPPPPTSLSSPPPPTPPPPPTSSSLPPPPPSKQSFPPPPQGTGSVESAPPAPPPPPSSSITGDPHFVGKHGERFDFHGKDGKDYCVVSDRDIHINMHVFRGKLRKSTFISKLGVLYRGQKILVKTQTSSLQSHLWKLVVDDVELRDVNSTFTRAGLSITRGLNFVRIFVPGEVDVLADIVRATFGKRGSLKDYINLQVKELRVSPEVHGLLGQTYKETTRAYEKLQAAKHKKRSRAAEVLVDGSESDYLTSDVLSSDCKFSTFEAQGAWHNRVKRTLFESMQTFLSLGMQDQIVVRDCVGFGDQSVCHA